MGSMAVLGDFSKIPQVFQTLFRKIAHFSAAE